MATTQARSSLKKSPKKWGGGIPDYSQPIAVTSDTDFEPPTDGIVYIIASKQKWPSIQGVVYVNDQQITLTRSYASTGDNAGILSDQILINKKYKYRFYGGTITFYPFE